MRAPRPVALVLAALLVALPVAQPLAAEGARNPDVPDPDLAVAGADELPPASGECPFPGAVDLDGAQHRRDVARATALFAASHPSAPVTGGDGQSGVLLRLPHVNFVDDEILGKIEAAGIPPAPLSSDTEFLRRVTLDLAGRIPDAAAVTAFLADHRPDKRARTIDQLLDSPEFNDRWALFLDDLFRNTANAASGRLFPAGRNAFHAYFLAALQSHEPYDAVARDLIAGLGVNTQNAPANFSVRNIQSNGPAQDTYDNLAATTGTAFLGLNAVFCTSCHNGSGHLDAINLWGAGVRRQDFWGMSAFFARTVIKPQGTPPDISYAVTEAPTGDYKLNTTTGNKTVRVACKTSTDTGCWETDPLGLAVVTPRFVLSGATPAAGEGYRQALARLVTADPQFAKATANYVFKELFTVGIVDPPDSFDLARQDPNSPPPSPWTIQPTHPQLLVKLGQAFSGSGFDLRALLRTLCNSSAYQLSSVYPGAWQDAYAPYFARHYVRRLGSEMLYDAIVKASGVPASLPVNGYPAPVTRAVQLPDISEPAIGSVRNFLNTFLRGNRDDVARSYQGSISQALSAMNDTNVTSRVKATLRGGTLNKLVAANATPATIVTQLYLATLSRPPAADELAAGTALLASPPPGETKTNAAEDLQWSLLNKLDFLFKY